MDTLSGRTYNIQVVGEGGYAESEQVSLESFAEAGERHGTTDDTTGKGSKQHEPSDIPADVRDVRWFMLVGPFSCRVIIPHALAIT